MQCQLSSRSDKKCARYPRCWKFFAAGKVDWSSLKSLKICYAPMPLTVPNITDLCQTMYEKSVTICLYLSVFWCPRGPRCAEVHQSRHWCTARADLPICQFRPLRQRVYEITAAEVRRFPWRCYRQKNRKRYVSAYAATEETLRSCVDNVSWLLCCFCSVMKLLGSPFEPIAIVDCVWLWCWLRRG